MAIPDTSKLQQLIQQNSYLFWWVPDDKKPNLSLDSLVEAILNYGNSASVKLLFEACGVSEIADIFYKQISKPRNNYLPITIHYFRLYFQKICIKKFYNQIR